MSAADPLEFLPGMAEKLGYYVYALRDPRGVVDLRDARTFYVGKGVGDRVYQHAALARVVDPDEGRRGLRLATIQAIHQEGLDVDVQVIRHGLTSEEAYTVEAAVIDALRMEGLDLTNLVSGHARGQGWRHLDDLRAEYAAPPIVIDPTHRGVLIRINRLYRYGMTAEDLYTAARQWWTVSPRRAPDYAFAVYNGIVRAVYRIDRSHGRNGWDVAPDSSKRWRFTGTPDSELEEVYLWRDVRQYLSNGAQNPIRYVGC